MADSVRTLRQTLEYDRPFSAAAGGVATRGGTDSHLLTWTVVAAATGVAVAFALWKSERTRSEDPLFQPL